MCVCYACACRGQTSGLFPYPDFISLSQGLIKPRAHCFLARLAGCSLGDPPNPTSLPISTGVRDVHGVSHGSGNLSAALDACAASALSHCVTSSALKSAYFPKGLFIIK